MKSPPWIHTMTGNGLRRGEVKFTSTGTKMLRYRQSSLTFCGYQRNILVFKQIKSYSHSATVNDYFEVRL